MIEGKKFTSPTLNVVKDVTKKTAEKPDEDSRMIESFGIPLIWDVLKSDMQVQLRLAGISGETQMKWYKVEKELLNWLRLCYTDKTEEQISAEYGPSDDYDGRTAAELDAKSFRPK